MHGHSTNAITNTKIGMPDADTHLFALRIVASENFFVERLPLSRNI